MPTSHLLAGDRQVATGACSNHYNGIPVLRAPAVHFPHCDPTDCYCLVQWGEHDCEKHEFIALSRRVVMCERCKSMPEEPLTHGQLKHARDRARAARKAVIGARHGRVAVAWDRRLVVLNDDITAATTTQEREAAVQRLRDAVAHFYRFGLRAS